VKCLGVLLDDGLTWKEQVQSVRKQSFAGLARLRRLKDVLPPNTATLRLLFCSVARMYERPEEATGEGTELWYAHHHPERQVRS